MSGAFDVLTRGTDTSGRPLRATRQAFQHFDRVNKRVGGKLVIVQGAFMGSGGADASAGTHGKAGCLDIRTWNLTFDERNTMIRTARQLGAAAWYRTPAQGFDEHSHWVLIGDKPMHPDAAQQVDMYRRGLNGLASGARDDFPFRPDPIRAYKFLEEEDDMPLSDDDVDRIAKAVWRHLIPVSKNEDRPAQLALRWAAERAQSALDLLRKDQKPPPKG